MKKSSYLVFVLIFIVAGALNVFAQRNNAISGFVFSGARQPVADIYVELQNEYGSTLTRVRTNGSGFYTFRSIPQGLYIVQVLTYGTNYQEQSRRITLTSISAVRSTSGSNSGGINEQVDFSLNVNRSYTGPLAAPGVIFAQDIPKNAEKLYNEGIELLGNKKEEEGFNKLKQAIEIFPDYFAALDRLGQEYVVKEYYRPAFVLLTNALKINPKSYSSSFGLGIAQFKLGQTDDALKSFKQAINSYADSTGAYLWLGIAEHAKGNLKEAEAALIQANKLSKEKSADVHYQLARLYSAQNRYNDAANELELYLKYSDNVSNSDKVKKSIETLRQKSKTS